MIKEYFNLNFKCSDQYVKTKTGVYLNGVVRLLSAYSMSNNSYNMQIEKTSIGRMGVRSAH